MVVTFKNIGESKEVRKTRKSPEFKPPGLRNNSPLFWVGPQGPWEQHSVTHKVAVDPPHVRKVSRASVSASALLTVIDSTYSFYLMTFSYSWLQLSHSFVFLLYISQLLPNHMRKSSLTHCFIWRIFSMRRFSYTFPGQPFLPCIEDFSEHLTSSQESS